jgi:hypothetical protein
MNLWAYAKLTGPLVLGKGGGGRVHPKERLNAIKKLLKRWLVMGRLN